MNLRCLDELVDTKEPAIDLIKQWIESAEVDCELLPPSPNRDGTLHYVQVTTRSPLGALAYDSGGLILQNGWVRFLGSGHPRLQRRLDSWNQGRADGFLLVVDDAVGGFFAINGGALGDDLGQAYYWAPDDLRWLSLEMSFTELLTSLMTNHINEFYADLRWPSWEADIANLTGDQSYSHYPFLWTNEGSISNSKRAIVPIHEIYDMKKDIVSQLAQSGA